LNKKDYDGPKYIVVTGGVISGVGKGLATASIGKILQHYGYKTTAIKIDPYLNYDAGTLRPTEHGEVWVTDDGGEIDLDLGNYERFLGIDLPRTNNLTTGQIYHTVIERERRGEYLGQTVQPIPHITDEIKDRIKTAATGFDIALIEIGGTIGDYENMPFLFAVKGLEREIGEENISYILVSYLPVPGHITEMKTKPTQHAIKLLGEHGMIPDFIICRAVRRLDDVRKHKIEVSANISTDRIISAPDADILYQVTLDFEEEGVGLKILDHLGLEPKSEPDWGRWRELLENIRNPSHKVKIAMVGKYVEIGDYELTDSYISVNQSLEHAGANLDTQVEISWIDSRKLEGQCAIDILSEFDGIIVPGAFGEGGSEGVIEAIRYAREHEVPYLGLCYGMQMAVVEYARNLVGLKDANSAENDPDSPHAVIDIQFSQREVIEESRYGGTMRLGGYVAALRRDSRVLALYEQTGRLEEDAWRIARLHQNPSEAFRLGVILESEKAVIERHRHRYEVSPKYVDLLEEYGLVFSGYHRREDGTKLMEFIELPDHPFFLATQAHPEFKSRLEQPAPLFYGFVDAVVKHANTRVDVQVSEEALSD
jgi:CTP synthase